jgi:aspartate/methionine/tyrosine aminotransferase
MTQEQIVLLADCVLEGWRVGRALGAPDDATEAAIAAALVLRGASPDQAALLAAIGKGDDPEGWVKSLGGYQGQARGVAHRC